MGLSHMGFVFDNIISYWLKGYECGSYDMGLAHMIWVWSMMLHDVVWCYIVVYDSVL